MAISLNRLTDREIQSLNMLFLARFAPDSGAEAPPMHPDHGVFPRYNYELFHVIQALGIRVTPCRELAGFLEIACDFNYVFTLYNRAPLRNPEVFVSSVCEFFHIPYLGAPPNIRALAEDKYLTKVLAASLGIPVSPGKVFSAPEETRQPPDFAGPYLIKPRFGAASEDISTASVQAHWKDALPRVIAMLENGKECLVERCVPGTDLTVAVLGGDPPILLPCAEEVSELPYGIATYRQKRLLDKSRIRRIPEDNALNERLGRYVRRLCRHLKPFDYLRVDFRRTSDTQELFLLEFNIACNLGSHAAIAQAARHVDMAHADLVNHIISYSLRRQIKVRV